MGGVFSLNIHRHSSLWYALTGRESTERAWAARPETPTQQVLALCRDFTAFAELFSLLFLVYFQDSLMLEEPVKVLKVAL